MSNQYQTFNYERDGLKLEVTVFETKAGFETFRSEIGDMGTIDEDGLSCFIPCPLEPATGFVLVAKEGISDSGDILFREGVRFAHFLAQKYLDDADFDLGVEEPPDLVDTAANCMRWVSILVQEFLVEFKKAPAQGAYIKPGQPGATGISPENLR